MRLVALLLRANRCMSLASLQVWPSPAAAQCLSALRLRYCTDHGWLASLSSPFELQVAGCCAWPAGTEALFSLSQVGKSEQSQAQISTSSCHCSPQCMLSAPSLYARACLRR